MHLNTIEFAYIYTHVYLYLYVYRDVYLSKGESNKEVRKNLGFGEDNVFW